MFSLPSANSEPCELVIEDDDMRAMLIAEKEARKSEETLKIYEAVEVDTSYDRDWMQVTAELQRRIAAEYCARQGLPKQRVPQVVQRMRVAVSKERFADVGLPQQWPVNRARRGNLMVGEKAPSVALRPVLLPPPSTEAGNTAAAGVGQAIQFPAEVCRKPYTVVVGGSYS